MQYHIPGGPWRQCFNGEYNQHNPASGCVAARLVGGLGYPLREAAFLEEEAVGHSCSPIPRKCVACMLAHTKSQTTSHKRIAATHSGEDLTRTMQEFQVDPSEWDPSDLIFPANVDGIPNGIAAPFLCWNPSFTCHLQANVPLV